MGFESRRARTFFQPITDQYTKAFDSLAFERYGPAMTRVHAPPTTEHSALFPTLLVALAAIGFGLVPLFARTLTDLGFTATEVAVIRYSIPAIVFLPMFWRERRHVRPLAFGVLAGMSMGLGWITYVIALREASVATVGVLYMTYPLFTLLIGWTIFREKPGIRTIFAGILILVGAILSASEVTVSSSMLQALAFSLLAPLSFGLAINILTRLLVDLSPPARMASASVGTMLSLVPLLIVQGDNPFAISSLETFAILIAFSALTAFLPQLIYVINAPKIGAARSAMVGSLELPTMFAVGLIAFSEKLSLGQLIAGALVITAILITPARPANRSVSLKPVDRPVRTTTQ